MKMLLRPLAIAAGVSVLAAVSSCTSTTTPATTPSASGKLTIVATTTQVADFARNVGGDRVKVIGILKPNVDPHDYEPTPADITSIGAAKLVLKNGVGLEKWLDQTISSAGFTGTVVDTSAGVTIRKGADEAEKEGDPHLWHNPQNAKLMAQNIEKALAAADPGGTAEYQKNFDNYAAKIDALDAAIKTKLESIPVGQRKLVTNHDALGYYVEHYQLEFVGSIIPSIDTSAELSAKDITDIVAKIKATGAKAVFSESSLPAKTAESIAKQAGVQVVAGEDSLYSDTLGPEGSAGATYLAMEEHNTDIIVKALRG